MEFLSKIEAFINQLIIRLGEWITRNIIRFTPLSVKKILLRLNKWQGFIFSNFKSLPRILKENAINSIKKIKTLFVSINFKTKFNESYKAALEQYKTQNSKGVSIAKAMFVAPFLRIGHWRQGLTTAQTLLLMGFTAASFWAGINIIFSGHRLVENQFKSDRTPASIEEELQYDRPEYYKMERRHVLVTNIRLPVYFPEVNQIKSVDIDFAATLSNRSSRRFLEKHEFQLRDHLIQNLEPLVAEFTLEKEGKIMLKEKIWKEIDFFLTQKQVEGKVEDIEITYILAN